MSTSLTCRRAGGGASILAEVAEKRCNRLEEQAEEEAEHEDDRLEEPEGLLICEWRVGTAVVDHVHILLPVQINQSSAMGSEIYANQGGSLDANFEINCQKKTQARIGLGFEGLA